MWKQKLFANMPLPHPWFGHFTLKKGVRYQKGGLDPLTLLGVLLHEDMQIGQVNQSFVSALFHIMFYIVNQ